MSARGAWLLYINEERLNCLKARGKSSNVCAVPGELVTAHSGSPPESMDRDMYLVRLSGLCEVAERGTSVVEASTVSDGEGLNHTVWEVEGRRVSIQVRVATGTPSLLAPILHLMITVRTEDIPFWDAKGEMNWEPYKWAWVEGAKPLDRTTAWLLYTSIETAYRLKMLRSRWWAFGIEVGSPRGLVFANSEGDLDGVGKGNLNAFYLFGAKGPHVLDAYVKWDEGGLRLIVWEVEGRRAVMQYIDTPTTGHWAVTIRKKDIAFWDEVIDGYDEWLNRS